MGNDAGLEATQPEAITGKRVGDGRQLALRWVFPSARMSLLHDGHCFGRDPGCDSVLPGNEVSRRHAQIERDGPLPLLRDLESRNGVFVGGTRVGAQTLGPGDVVRIGEWVGVVVELPATGAIAVSALQELAPGFYGGPVVEAALAPLRAVATTDLAVVIQGETGTGKEGATQALHRWSGRAGALIAVDCGALPEQLAEGILFGQRRGAFTGADRDRLGHFRAADGGTLFLDEVLNLPLTVQAKLLRAIETKTVLPLGESQPIAVDVRVVSAAQGSLRDSVAAGHFRADLMARLDGVTIKLPALRQRREEIVALFFELSERHAGASACDARFAEALLLYDWPLNVRELVLLARQLAALHQQRPLRRSFLPERMVPAAARSDGEALDPSRVLAVERLAAGARKPAADGCDFEALSRSLHQHQGNLTRAAAALGLSRARAYRVLRAHPEFDFSTLRKDVEG